MSGYSGTPLPRKLGIADGHTVVVTGSVPKGFIQATLAPLPDGVTVKTTTRARPDVLLFFTARRRDLENRLEALGRAVFPDALLWVAWPKKASGVLTDMTEDVVRDVALPHGLVDTKVCAIDDTWSGLRLVWRRERRG